MDSERSEPADDAGGFRLYAAYIEEQLQNQEARKESVEDRASSVITASGALATIILGFTSFAPERGSLALTDASREAIQVALVAFVVAALLALLTSAPLPYKKPKHEELRRTLNAGWTDTEALASSVVADSRLDLLAHAGRLNTVKASLLIAAMLAEVVAVAALARAAWLIV